MAQDFVVMAVHDVGQAADRLNSSAEWRPSGEASARGPLRPSSFSTALINTIDELTVAAPVLAQEHGGTNQAQIDGMRMVDDARTRENRLASFLEGMLEHHGGALMACSPCDQDVC